MAPLVVFRGSTTLQMDIRSVIKNLLPVMLQAKVSKLYYLRRLEL